MELILYLFFVAYKDDNEILIENAIRAVTTPFWIKLVHNKTSGTIGCGKL